MGLLSKIKNLFFKQKEGKIFFMSKYWGQEELKAYFGYGLDLLYYFTDRYDPKDGVGTQFLLIAKIYQALIFEKKFSEHVLIEYGVQDIRAIGLIYDIDYDVQDIRAIGLLYGLDNIYKKNDFIKFLKKININKNFIKKILSEHSLEKSLAEESRLTSEFILQYSLSKNETIENMVDNPLIDKFFIKYLYDNGVLKEDFDNFSFMMARIELYKQSIKRDLDYLLKKTKNFKRK